MSEVNVFPHVAQCDSIMNLLREDLPLTMGRLDAEPKAFAFTHAAAVTPGGSTWIAAGPLALYQLSPSDEMPLITPEDELTPLQEKALIELNSRTKWESYAAAMSAVLPYRPIDPSGTPALSRIRILTTRHGIALLDTPPSKAIIACRSSSTRKAQRDLGQSLLTWVLQTDDPEESAHARLERHAALRRASKALLRLQGATVDVRFAVDPRWTAAPATLLD